MKLVRRHRDGIVPGTTTVRKQKMWTLEAGRVRVTLERVIGLYGLPDTVSWSIRWWRSR